MTRHMTRWIVLAAAACLSTGCMLFAQALPTPPTSAPAAASATQGDAVPKDVEAILDRNEAAGEKVASVRAKMVYVRNQVLVDEITTRKGSVLYLRKVDASKPAGQQEQILGRIQFDTLQTDLYTSTKKEVYSFYDRFVHELNEKTEQLVHREIVPPGEAMNPFKLGQGPFPIPFGQTKKDVLGSFTVKLIPPGQRDPAKSDHLELTPRAGSDLARKYKKLHWFVSRDLNLPVRIVTEAGDETATVDFTDIEINPKLSEEDFKLKKPDGYQETTVPRGK